MEWLGRASLVCFLAAIVFGAVSWWYGVLILISWGLAVTWIGNDGHTDPLHPMRGFQRKHRRRRGRK